MTRANTMAALAFGALILAGPASARAEEPPTFELDQGTGVCAWRDLRYGRQAFHPG